MNCSEMNLSVYRCIYYTVNRTCKRLNAKLIATNATFVNYYSRRSCILQRANFYGTFVNVSIYAYSISANYVAHSSTSWSRHTHVAFLGNKQYLISAHLFALVVLHFDGTFVNSMHTAFQQLVGMHSSMCSSMHTTFLGNIKYLVCAHLVTFNSVTS